MINKLEQNMVLAIKQPDLSVNKATADMENEVLAKKKRYLWRVAMKLKASPVTTERQQNRKFF